MSYNNQTTVIPRSASGSVRTGRSPSNSRQSPATSSSQKSERYSTPSSQPGFSEYTPEEIEEASREVADLLLHQKLPDDDESSFCEAEKIEDDASSAMSDVSQPSDGEPEAFPSPPVGDDSAKHVERVFRDAITSIRAAFTRTRTWINTVAGSSSDDGARAVEKAKDIAKYYSDRVYTGLRDPAVSTTVLFSAVSASAAACYLSYQLKHGSHEGSLIASIAFGVGALSVAEYFSVKAYFRRNNK